MSHFNCWNGVNGAVLNGIKLREEKNRLCPTSKQYEVVDIALREPSCSRTSPWPNLKRLSDNFTSIQESTNIIKKRKKTSTNKPFGRVKTRCSLRVAELSVPSKRHCLETWRNNSNILPSFMVERLRQIVMDEKPIVDIYYAIDCFKRRKTPRDSRSASKKNVKNKHQEQIRLFCAIISYKIIHKLLQPLNLTLNTKLKALSRVVDDEISCFLKSSNQSTLNTNNIQTEIADKITVWIANILEESANKLLLEEFHELKEKEGPVWDLIDELIDNIAVICEPVSIITTSSSLTELSISLSQPNLNEDLSFTEENASENEYDEISSNSKDIQQVQESDLIIEYILDSIINNAKIMSPSENSINKNDSDRTDESINNIHENSNKNVTNIEFSIHENKDSNDYLKISEVSFESETSLKEIDSQIYNLHDIDDNSTSLINNDSLNQLNRDIKDVENMSKIIETAKEITHNIDTDRADKTIESTENEIEELHEDTPDDSIKKVKFSNLNIGAYRRITSISNDSNSFFIRENYNDVPKKFSKDESIKSELQFASPNEHLLSDADESWPENLHFPVLKATISVSKSILSLGKILESEEKQLKSVEKDADSINADRKDSITQLNQTYVDEQLENDKNVAMYETEKKSQENCINNNNRSYQENNDTDFITTFDDVIQKEILPKRETTTTPKNHVINMVIENMPVINIKPISKDIIIHEEAIQTEQEVLNNVYNHTSSTKDFLRWHKLHQNSQGANVQSLKICKCANFIEEYDRKEIEVRRWCKGLENVMQNLELWTDWVDKTCKCIMLLKVTGIKKCLDKKFKEDDNYIWIKLKINVDSDSKIWRKVSKSLKSGITKYKNYYVKDMVSQI